MSARLAALASGLLLAAGCGGDAAVAGEPLTVFAAASLTEVFQRLDADARFNFAGSDALATQLREGARADVFAAASPRHPSELESDGLVERPRIFATNELVLIVPSDNPARVGSVADLERDGIKLVVGDEGVPVGDYTRQVVANLGATEILGHVVSHEDDVKGVVAKVVAGEADAGFVYATDARAAGAAVRTIELPERAQAKVEYPIAVVAESERRDEAERFIELVLGREGRRALAQAGFGLP